jgi:spore maturation protein CgeB
MISADTAIVEASYSLLRLGRRASAHDLVTSGLSGAPVDMMTLRMLATVSAELGLPRPAPTHWARFGTVTRARPRAQTILDQISEVNWATDLWGTRFVRERAFEQMDTADYDLVLMESIWRGYKDDWLYSMTSPGLQHPHARALVALLGRLRERADKPIVMINKEDPLHYDKFLPIMRYADHIFTTDSERLAAYRRDTDALTVTAMPFAANLTLTNPMDRVREPQEDVCFAGSYYSEGHEERSRQMHFMLDPIVQFKGAIYDRMSVHYNPRYHFPEQFRPYIRPAVGFEQMTRLYRQFRVFLNVNTIVTSPTMMSRRVYELLASGTPVVSAPSLALEQQFSGIVHTATTAHEANDQVNRLLTDDHHWWKTSQKGIREVALKHQYRHRGALIRETVLGQSIDRQPKLVSVVMSTKRSDFLDRIVENLTRQTYPRMEIILALHDVWPAEKIAELTKRLQEAPQIERVKVLTFPNIVSLGLKLNASIAQAQGEFIAKMDDDDWYFPNYLQDMILTFDFSGADLAGKWSFPVWLEAQDKLILRNPGHEHKLAPPFVAGPTFVARKAWLEKLLFADRSQGEDTDLIHRTVAAGGKIYSADHFNFILYRAADVGHHTWKADDGLFERTGITVGSRKDFADWVV